MLRIAGVLAAVSILCACSAEPDLRNLRSLGEGPDEFALVPAKPLEAPESYTSLPAPTPGGANRTDQQPLSDAYAALGGRASSPNAAIPAREAALVTHASRFGVEQNIRSELATADQRFRDRQRRFANIRIFREDRYAQIYRRQALNPSQVAAQYRAAGVPTPSAPPATRRQRR